MSQSTDADVAAKRNGELSNLTLHHADAKVRTDPTEDPTTPAASRTEDAKTTPGTPEVDTPLKTDARRTDPTEHATAPEASGEVKTNA